MHRVDCKVNVYNKQKKNGKNKVHRHRDLEVGQLYWRTTKVKKKKKKCRTCMCVGFLFKIYAGKSGHFVCKNRNAKAPNKRCRVTFKYQLLHSDADILRSNILRLPSHFAFGRNNVRNCISHIFRNLHITFS